MNEYHVSYHVFYRLEGGVEQSAFGDMVFTPDQDGPISRKDVQDMKNIIREYNENKEHYVEQIVILSWIKYNE